VQPVGACQQGAHLGGRREAQQRRAPVPERRAAQRGQPRGRARRGAGASGVLAAGRGAQVLQQRAEQQGPWAQSVHDQEWPRADR